jgi:hypothetical protein
MSNIPIAGQGGEQPVIGLTISNSGTLQGQVFDFDVSGTGLTISNAGTVSSEKQSWFLAENFTFNQTILNSLDVGIDLVISIRNAVTSLRVEDYTGSMLQIATVGYNGNGYSFSFSGTVPPKKHYVVFSAGYPEILSWAEYRPLGNPP